MKLTKKRYLQGFLAVVLLLAAVRAVFPQVAVESGERREEREMTEGSEVTSPHSPLSTQNTTVSAPWPTTSRPSPIPMAYSSPPPRNGASDQ